MNPFSDRLKLAGVREHVQLGSNGTRQVRQQWSTFSYTAMKHVQSDGSGTRSVIRQWNTFSQRAMEHVQSNSNGTRSVRQQWNTFSQTVVEHVQSDSSGTEVLPFSRFYNSWACFFCPLQRDLTEQLKPFCPTVTKGPN